MHSKLIMAKNTLIERTDSMDERLFYRYTPDKPESPPSPPKNTPKKNKIDFKVQTLTWYISMVYYMNVIII